MDVQMPKIDGYTVTGIIRSCEQDKKINESQQLVGIVSFRGVQANLRIKTTPIWRQECVGQMLLLK